MAESSKSIKVLKIRCTRLTSQLLLTGLLACATIAFLYTLAPTHTSCALIRLLLLLLFLWWSSGWRCGVLFSFFGDLSKAFLHPAQVWFGPLLLHRLLHPAGQADLPDLPQQRDLPHRRLPGRPPLLCHPHTTCNWSVPWNLTQ